MKKTKAILLCGFAGMMMLAAVASPIIDFLKAGDRLSVEQIEARREEYPIQETQPPLFCTYPLAFGEVVEMGDTLLYAEVTQDVSASKYKVRAIRDTKCLFRTGEEITLTMGSVFSSYAPHFSQGSRILLPVWREEKAGNWEMSTLHIFYVTEDRYVLSVSYRDEMTAYDGRQLKSLLLEFL